MASVPKQIRDHGAIVVMNVPSPQALMPCAVSAWQGGLALQALPVSFPSVVEAGRSMLAQIAVTLGMADVVDVADVTAAVDAGAAFIVSPIVSPEVIGAAHARGLVAIAGAFTPTEVAAGVKAGADFVALHPAGAFPDVTYFEHVARSFPTVPLLVSGGVDAGSAPGFLEAGAAAAVIDRGLFPERDAESNQQVVQTRALALTEVCADAIGTPPASSVRPFGA